MRDDEHDGTFPDRVRPLEIAPAIRARVMPRAFRVPASRAQVRSPGIRAPAIRDPRSYPPLCSSA